MSDAKVSPVSHWEMQEACGVATIGPASVAERVEALETINRYIVQQEALAAEHAEMVGLLRTIAAEGWVYEGELSAVAGRLLARIDGAGNGTAG